jgi:hypothetical protein
VSVYREIPVDETGIFFANDRHSSDRNSCSFLCWGSPLAAPFHKLPALHRGDDDLGVSVLNYFCPMTIEELYLLYRQHPSVQTDTRKIRKGDIFFALKGPNFNGNSFAKQAIEAGAAYAIVDEKEITDENKIIWFEDVLGTLQELAKFHRLHFEIPFIAITGSNGKTTTKELIHAVLSSTFKTITTQGNLNNHI